MRYKALHLAAMMLLVPLFLGAQEYPSCVHSDRSRIYRNEGDGLKAFYDKLDRYWLYNDGEVCVWHLGDSHLQAEYLPDRMRRDFTSSRPDLRFTRGLLFPYSAAGTNYLGDYRISLSGNWTFSSLLKPGNDLIGISGRLAKTTDLNPGITLQMNASGGTGYSFNLLRVFGYSDVPGTTLTARINGIEYRAVETSYGYEFHFNGLTESVEISISMPTSGQFALSALAPDYDGPAFRYISSGVNGAEVCQWNRCNLLMTEVACFKPDLVIIGLGTNDAVVRKGTFNSSKFKSDYAVLINSIRSMSPGCAIILVPSNDIFLRGVNNVWNNEVEKSVYEIAAENGAAIWDWLDVMGGLGSMNEWLSAGLAAKDRIHLNKEGYTIVADLFYKAVMDDYISGK